MSAVSFLFSVLQRAGQTLRRGCAGKPKGVVLTHRGVCQQMKMAALGDALVRLVHATFLCLQKCDEARGRH